jgi:hypothetical protein
MANTNKRKPARFDPTFESHALSAVIAPRSLLAWLTMLNSSGWASVPASVPRRARASPTAHRSPKPEPSVAASPGLYAT